MSNAIASAPARATEKKSSPADGVVAVADDVTSGKYAPSQEEQLFDYLQRAETVAFLLSHNFGGDGSFETPTQAPGLMGMCAFVSAQLQAAEKLSHELGMRHEGINFASSIAQHMVGLSTEELYGGAVGFRLGDGIVAMSYWTIEHIAKAAYEELSA